MPIRPLSLDDVPALARQVTLNRDFLAPFEPTRDDEYFTEAGQLAIVQATLEQQALGGTAAFVIHDDGQLVGRITLNEIVRGPLQSCSLGYWVAESHNGGGLASSAVRDVLRAAFDDLRLHRVQAGTLLHNTRSQHVLARNGFVRIGVAPQMLRIQGRWQDHILFQALAPSTAQPDHLGHTQAFSAGAPRTME